MESLEDAVDSMADRTAFSGVVRIDRPGEVAFVEAYGLADRGHGIPNTIDTQFAIASGTKGLTALAVVSLIDGRLAGPHHHGTFGAWGGSSPHPRRRDDRAPAVAPIRHR